MITTSFRVCDGVDSDGWESGKTLIFLWTQESENMGEKLGKNKY